MVVSYERGTPVVAVSSERGTPLIAVSFERGTPVVAVSYKRGNPETAGADYSAGGLEPHAAREVGFLSARYPCGRPGGVFLMSEVPL